MKKFEHILYSAVGLVALATGADLRGAVFSLCFVLPYLLAAGLFRHAAQEAALALPRNR